NEDLRQRVFSGLFKQQLTPQDSLYVQVVHNDLHSGDLRQYYNFDNSLTNLPGPSPRLRVEEVQQPNLFIGYHHEWTPGSHTLLLLGRLDDTLSLREPKAQIQSLVTDSRGQVTTNIVDPALFDLRYAST